MGILSAITGGLSLAGSLFGKKKSSGFDLSSLLGAVEPMAKIAGIPMPGGATGAQLGKDAKAYFDKAFPGTNAWERLGSSYGGSSVEAAKQTTRAQERMQTKELATRKDIAEIGAEAQVQSSAIQFGGDAVAGVSRFRRDGSTPNYDTHSTIAAKKLAHEIRNIDQDTRKKFSEEARNLVEAHKTGLQNKIEREYAKFAKAIAEARLAGQLTQNKYNVLLNAARGIYKLGENVGERINKGISPAQTSVPAKRNRGKVVRGSTHYKNQ